MSLNKAIYYGKEHRKPYHGAKAANTNHCNHGSCDYCYNNRTYSKRKAAAIAKEKIYEAGYCDFNYREFI